MRKIGIYARVSTEEQARVEEGSVKNQVETLPKFIEAENLKESRWGQLVDVYKDEGYSAKNLKRPELERLIQDIAKRRINTVLITEISRMSRSVKDWIDLRAFFDENDATFIATRQRFDTSTAMGRAMLDFAIQFAQLEREMTVERVKASYQGRASRGLWPGGPVPYGLDLTPDRPGHLQVNAAKQIIANDILDILTERAGYATKAVELIREAGYLRDGGTPWDENALCRWVRNRALIGEQEVNSKNEGRDETHLPESERYKIVPAVWGAVVEKEKWLRANALLDQNYKKLKVAMWKYNEFLLTGLLRCPSGVSLTGASAHGRSEKYPYYRHQRKCSCDIKLIHGVEIEKVVLRKLREIAASDATIAALSAKANEDLKKAQPNYRESLLAAKRRLDGIVTQLERVTDEILVATSPEDRRLWTEKSHRVQAEKDQVEREIQALEKNRHNADAGTIEPKAVQDALGRFLDGFDSLPFAARRGLVTSLLDSIQVERTEVILNIKNPGFSEKNPPVPTLSSRESGGHLLDNRIKWGERLEFCRTHMARFQRGNQASSAPQSRLSQVP